MTPLICFFAENILQNNLQVMITLRKKEYILISYQCLDPIWIFWTQKQSKQDKISEIFYSLCISNCDMHIVLCVKGPKWRRDNHPYFLHAPAQHLPQPAFKIFTAIYRKISQPQTRQMITLLWKTLYARPDLFLWPLQMWTTSKTPIIRNLLCTDQNWSFTAPFCHQVCKPANCEKISKKANWPEMYWHCQYLSRPLLDSARSGLNIRISLYHYYAESTKACICKKQTVRKGVVWSSSKMSTASQVIFSKKIPKTKANELNTNSNGQFYLKN